jgi:hypothetical protein
MDRGHEGHDWRRRKESEDLHDRQNRIADRLAETVAHEPGRENQKVGDPEEGEGGPESKSVGWRVHSENTIGLTLRITGGQWSAAELPVRVDAVVMRHPLEAAPSARFRPQADGQGPPNRA